VFHVRELFFVPLFSFVGSIVLHNVRRFKRGTVPHGNRITVALITAICRGRRAVAQKRTV
jgi:hypothetical protein